MTHETDTNEVSPTPRTDAEIWEAVGLSEPTPPYSTDACPHCGAESYLSEDAFHDADGNPQWRSITRYECGSTAGNKATICFEREHRKKAEAEVDRLTGLIREIVTACAERGLPQVAQEIAKQLNNPDNK